MRRITEFASVGSLLLAMCVAAAVTPPLHAQGPGEHRWLCQYHDPKDLAKPALGSRVYYSVVMSSDASLNAKPFIGYVQQHYKLTEIPGDPTGEYNGTAGGYCRRISDLAAGRANSMDAMKKMWASSNMEAVEVSYGDAAAQPSASAAGAPAAPAAPALTAVASGGAWVSCATSGGAGIDTYLTGVFQTTRPVRHLPNGGVLVDQAILDHFYAYLTQKGYTFKPGSNYACDVSATEAQAKAAQHKRHYEGGGCSTCGKTVETGWTDK